jgi:hypothetical protein
MRIVAMGIHKEFATVRRTGRGHQLGLYSIGQVHLGDHCPNN